jgi:hypothetical protein
MHRAKTNPLQVNNCHETANHILDKMSKLLKGRISMGRPPIFKKPMTHAQYKRRYRAKLKAKALAAKHEQRAARKAAATRAAPTSPTADQ